MAQQNLNLGTGNDSGDGDTLRAAMTKVEANTTELYERIFISAASDPTVNDDVASTSGNGTFEEGTVWIRQDNNTAFICVDNTATTAVWTGIPLTASEVKAAYEGNADTNAFTDALLTKLNNIEALADVTDETNVVAALSGAIITDAGTPAAGDKILIQDISDSDNLKYVNVSDVTADNTADIADIRTTQGTSDGDTHLGTFTGSTISDNGTVKAGMQELETALEGSVTVHSDVTDAGSGAIITTTERSKLGLLNTFAASTDPAQDTAATTAVIDANFGVVITTTGTANTQALGTPTDTSRRMFVVAVSDSSTHPVVVNGVAIQPNQNKAFIWDGANWDSDHISNDILLGQSTGLVSGGTLSINGGDAATLDIAAGEGCIVDISNPELPVFNHVSWNAFSGVAMTNLATNPVTYICINSAGGVNQSTSLPTREQARDKIFLGVAVHSDNTAISVVNNIPYAVGNNLNQTHDLIAELGTINSGNLVSANGANLSINKSVGTLFKLGVNYDNNIKEPHKITTTSSTLATFRYRLQDSTEYTNTTVVDPNNYDNAGVLTSVPSNDWTIQRFYLFPSNTIRAQYGQDTYSTKSLAIQNAAVESFVVESNIDENGTLIGLLVVKEGATDLTNGDSVFLNVDRFGQTSSSSSGISTSTLQNVYDNSSTPEITLTSAVGGVTIADASTPIGANLLEVTNNAGTTEYFSVDSSGVDVAGSVNALGANFPVGGFERTSSVTNGQRFAVKVCHTTSSDMVDGFGSGIGLYIEDSSAVSNAIGGIAAIRDGADNEGQLVLQAGTNGAENLLRIRAGGNVGINTDDPQRRLHVTDNSASVLARLESTNTFGTGLELHNTDTGANNWSIYSSASGNTDGAGHLVFHNQTSNTGTAGEKIRIDASGDLGLGISSPTNKLHVRASDGNGLTVDRGDATVSFDINYVDSSTDFEIGTSTSHRIRFKTADTTRMQINSSGQVAIGGTPIQVGFGVFNTGGGQIRVYRDDATITTGEELGTLQFQGTQGAGLVGASVRAEADENWAAGTNAGGKLIFRTTTNGSVSATDKVVIDNEGNLGVGDTNPANILSVKASDFSYFERTSALTSTAAAGLVVKHLTSGDMVDGFGSGISFNIGDAGDTDNYVGKIFGIMDGADTEGALSFRAGTNGDEEFLRIRSDGNVGIGLFTGNTAKLTVVRDGGYNSEGTNGIKVQNASSSPSVSLNIGTDASNNISFIQSMEPLTSFTTKALVLQGNGGNVGVGIINPQAKLTVGGGTNSLASGIGFEDGDTGIYEGSANQLRFTFGGNIRMLINSSIIASTGSNNTYYMPHGFTPTAAGPAYSFKDDTDTGMYTSGADTLNFSTGGTERFKIDSSGKSVFSGFVNLGASSTLTIAAGVVTATKSYHSIDTEAAAASDDLDTINGGTDGDILVIKSAVAARDIVVKHGTGNIALDGGVDFTIDDNTDTLTLMYNGALWLEVSRSNNG